MAGRRGLSFALIVGACAPGATAMDRGPGATAEFIVVGDTVPAPLGGAAGDVERGRILIEQREAANCVLCHAVPDPAVRYAGNVGPSLDGVARRQTIPQLRLRVIDSLRLNAASVMPAYYRTAGLDRVATAYQGKPILDAGQVEDIVAYLGTLQ